MCSRILSGPQPSTMHCGTTPLTRATPLLTVCLSWRSHPRACIVARSVHRVSRGLSIVDSSRRAPRPMRQGSAPVVGAVRSWAPARHRWMPCHDWHSRGSTTFPLGRWTGSRAGIWPAPWDSASDICAARPDGPSVHRPRSWRWRSGYAAQRNSFATRATRSRTSPPPAAFRVFVDSMRCSASTFRCHQRRGAGAECTSNAGVVGHPVRCRGRRSSDRRSSDRLAMANGLRVRYR